MNFIPTVKFIEYQMRLAGFLRQAPPTCILALIVESLPADDEDDDDVCEVSTDLEVAVAESVPSSAFPLLPESSPYPDVIPRIGQHVVDFPPPPLIKIDKCVSLNRQSDLRATNEHTPVKVTSAATPVMKSSGKKRKTKVTPRRNLNEMPLKQYQGWESENIVL
jgi:hypothetical protein